MINPLISIIIPVFNRSNLIGQTLDSIIRQKYENWECIIVDDGSEDNTLEVVKNFCKKDLRFSFYRRPNERTKGANSCRNIGFEQCKGNFVLFFDSDDLIEKEIFLEVIDVFTKNPEIDFVYNNYCVFESSIYNIIIQQNNRSVNPLLDYFAGRINLATGAVIWRRNSISKITFNEELKKTQELDFIFRLFQHSRTKKLTGLYTGKNAFFMRKHENSIVAHYKKGIPSHLLSDVFVRNNICSYFSHSGNKNILEFQKKEMRKSFHVYLYRSNFRSFFRVIRCLILPNKKIKIELLFYKLIFRSSKRSYRFSRAIKNLYGYDFRFNFDRC